MRLVSLAWMLALSASAIGLAAGPGTPQPTLPEPITTRQTLFSIPFQIDRAEDPTRQPVEVQLYVSADQGANWQLYGRVKPEQRHFLFRAVTDGEYWFAIRTLDRAAQLRPERADGPGLRVVVDTTLPELALQARQGEAGQVILRWQVTEPHLDLDTLKIQYRSEAGGPWQSVAIDRQSTFGSGPTSTGEVIWWPELSANVVEIRAEVADAAGNLAVSHAQVSLQRVASAGRDRGAGGDVQAGLAGPGQPPAFSWRGSTDFSSPPSQDYRSGTVSPQHGAIATGGPAHAAASATPSWYDQTQRDGTASAPRNPSAWPPQGSLTAGINPAMRNQFMAPRQGAMDVSGSAPLTSHLSAPASSGSLPLGTSGLPASQRPQMVNSRLFELEYHVDSVGPSGVGRIQLWGTRDGGRTWTSYGVDHDKQSPMLVTVQEEGIYGFRVAIQNALGVGGERPLSGDQPDVWIGVDLTKPSCRILSAERPGSDQTGRLIICWEADDQMLSDRPVSLFYSETPAGPWLEIATGLQNTGSYAWSAGRRLPERIYLRLEVHDAAGNVAVFEPHESVALNAAGPMGRIDNVRPVVGSSQAGPMHYRVQ